MGGIRIIVDDTMICLEKLFFVKIAQMAQTKNKVMRIAAILTLKMEVVVADGDINDTSLFNNEDSEILFGAVRRVSLEAKSPRFSKNGNISSIPRKSKKEVKNNTIEYIATRIDAHILFL